MITINHYKKRSHRFCLNEFVHSKNCWVVLTQIWVEYGQTQMLG